MHLDTAVPRTRVFVGWMKEDRDLQLAVDDTAVGCTLLLPHAGIWGTHCCGVHAASTPRGGRVDMGGQSPLPLTTEAQDCPNPQGLSSVPGTV